MMLHSSNFSLDVSAYNFGVIWNNTPHTHPCNRLDCINTCTLLTFLVYIRKHCTSTYCEETAFGHDFCCNPAMR